MMRGVWCRALVICDALLVAGAAACVPEDGRALRQTTSAPAHDVGDVRFRGDGTIMGMEIRALQATATGFQIETTGARFEYAAGTLYVYQGLTEPRRRVASLVLGGAPALEARESTRDHVLFWSPAVHVGVYGDSTVVLAAQVPLNVCCQGEFKPEYEGTHKGELLLIDDAGGLAVVPARYGPDYEVSELRLGVRDWVAAYALPPGQRMMVAAFPGRPFDWERSFHCHFVTTYGSMGRGTGNAYGEMPPEGVIASWAQTFDIVFLSFEGLYERKRPGSQYPHPGGPYTVANPAEFRRFVSTARRYGMKVTPYTSPYNCITQPQDLESYLAQVAALQRDFQIGGVYVDGLLTDTTHRRGVDDKLGSWEIVRRLREMFGADGVILLHGTAIGNPVGVLPNTDTYCDVVLCGEGVESHAVDEPYVRYRVRKYGISNTVGMWCCKIEGISWPERLRATLAMNCRMRWGSYVPMREPPPNNRYTWNTKLDWWYVQYRRALREVEERYHATVRSPPSGRPGP